MSTLRKLKWSLKKVIQGFRNLIIFFKPVWRYQCWDYGYMLEMELAQLEYNIKYWSNPENIHIIESSRKRVLRDLKLERNLLKMIMNGNPYLIMHKGFDVNDNDEITGSAEWEFKHYVNTSTASKYSKFCAEGLKKHADDLSYCELLKSHLYDAKVWYLYHKIRKERMEGWWD